MFVRLWSDSSLMSWYVGECSSILFLPLQALTGFFEQFCASMWTPEESAEIQGIAREIVPDIKTHAIPQGLQVEKGPDAIVEYLKEQIPKLLG